MLLDGRFVLGVGTGEALNEHILGDAWPAAGVRLEMLEEAVEIIRELWEGGSSATTARTTCRGRADLHAARDAAGHLRLRLRPEATELAGRIGDGFCTMMPDRRRRPVPRRRRRGKPVQGGTKVC